MRIYEQLFKGVDGVATARCTLVPCGDGYFEGVKSVGDFSTERIVLYFARESVEIVGENLSIGKYYEEDLYLTGRILSVTVLESADDSAQKTGR